MRIIAGKYRHRRLKTLPGRETRPMPDRLREALFSAIAHEIEGKTFADLYAGSGAVGIEALSRGAALSIFVESSAAAVRVIQENLRALGVGQEAHVTRATVQEALSGLSADVCFLGPPYALGEEYSRTLDTLGEAPSCLVIAQHAARHELGGEYGRLRRSQVIRQGSNSLSLYRP